MKVSEVIFKYRNSLGSLYNEGELSQVIFLVLEHVKSFSKIDLTLKRDETISEDETAKFDFILSVLKTNKPVQYILGYSWFCGMKLQVNERVLIPRQETEELVDWVIKDEGRGARGDLKILDVCTGSGCIALALKKKFPQSEVFALDISEQALKIAKENSRINNLEVNFIKENILAPQTQYGIRNTPFDIIVSNPPYVMESEKQQMNPKVTDFEPHLALFVKDNDPLVFYKAISDFALSHLKPGGKIYFEINETKGKEITELLIHKGFSDVVLKKDLNGKDRMVKGILK